MVYSYTLVVLDEQGETIVDHDLTPDQAVQILAEALKAAPVQSEPVEEEPKVSTGKHRKPRQKRKVTKLVKDGQRARVCKRCGQPGHMAKTCGDRGLTQMLPRLTEDQFDQLKHLQKIGDLSSKDFAQEHGLAITEVNRAIASGTFEAYRDF